MAKIIKFHLNCNGVPIRTIGDLQDNFDIQDVLEYYKNGVLAKWLKVHGFGEELELLQGIVSEDTYEIVNRLVEIFDITDNEDTIKEMIRVIDLIEERKEKIESKESADELQIAEQVKRLEIRRRELEEENIKIEELQRVQRERIEKNKTDHFWKRIVLIDACRDDYQKTKKLVNGLLTNRLDNKEMIEIIRFLNSQEEIFINEERNEVENLFWNIIVRFLYDKHCYLSIWLLMKEKAIRDYLLSDVNTQEVLCDMTENHIIITDFIKKYKLDGTDYSWRTIEENGRDFMVLKITRGYDNHIRPFRSEKGKVKIFKEDDINGKFIILEGIEYMNTKPGNYPYWLNSKIKEENLIVYMEV